MRRGAGFRAIRRGANGNYYILTAPAPALQIYDAAGKRVGQIPNESAAKAKGAALVYGESFDVDREGRVAVCDRGANAVKIYAPGRLSGRDDSGSRADSVVFLAGGEVAVASPSTNHLVTVYDLRGNVVREYGDREEIADRADVNNQVNFGHLAADETGNTYFAFDYLPEPTVRKFDHAGYLAHGNFAQNPGISARGAGGSQGPGALDATATPALHRIISAMGVDAQTQDVWLAIGTLLMHFDKDGQRLASFRT